jgi:hypothetical protein
MRATSGEFNRRLAVEPLNLFSQKVDTNRPFQFQKRSKLFIRVYNEPLTVAVSVRNEDCSPLTIHSWDTAQLHPALLRSSAMISQYFTRRASH